MLSRACPKSTPATLPCTLPAHFVENGRNSTKCFDKVGDKVRKCVLLLLLLLEYVPPSWPAEADAIWKKLAPYFNSPAQYSNQFGSYKSPLQFDGGDAVRNASEWPRRRQEILRYWHHVLGPWPPLLEHP